MNKIKAPVGSSNTKSEYRCLQFVNIYLSRERILHSVPHFKHQSGLRNASEIPSIVISSKLHKRRFILKKIKFGITIYNGLYIVKIPLTYILYPTLYLPILTNYFERCNNLNFILIMGMTAHFNILLDKTHSLFTKAFFN